MLVEVWMEVVDILLNMEDELIYSFVKAVKANHVLIILLAK